MQPSVLQEPRAIYFTQGTFLFWLDSTNIDMVRIANFPCWFAKENENAVSVVESHQHLPNAFFSLKNAWLDVFL